MTSFISLFPLLSSSRSRSNYARTPFHHPVQCTRNAFRRLRAFGLAVFIHPFDFRLNQHDQGGVRVRASKLSSFFFYQHRRSGQPPRSCSRNKRTVAERTASRPRLFGTPLPASQLWRAYPFRWRGNPTVFVTKRIRDLGVGVLPAFLLPYASAAPKRKPTFLLFSSCFVRLAVRRDYGRTSLHARQAP